MVLDIDKFRPEKGGDPEMVKKNQRERFADETMVDKIVQADEKWRRGKLHHAPSGFIEFMIIIAL